MKYIEIKGARVNNLKNVTVKIPLNSLTVITGLSGSGKSSLAFDTLYAEGQRRYVESLSAWFADNLEVSIFSRTSDTSRNQAKQIVKSFFKTYSPRTFVISHKAGRPNMKYALGVLTAGGEMFHVTIFLGLKDSEYKIQQIKIERID